MNCREAQSQLFAERDAALDPNQLAALEGHLAHCGDCKRVRDDLAAAFRVWRADVNQAQAPDAEREWHAGGWIVAPRPWAGGAALTHTGTNTYWFSVAWLAPERGFAVLVACNTGADGAAKACDDAASALIQAYLKERRD